MRIRGDESFDPSVAPASHGPAIGCWSESHWGTYRTQHCSSARVKVRGSIIPSTARPLHQKLCGRSQTCGHTVASPSHSPSENAPSNYSLPPRWPESISQEPRSKSNLPALSTPSTRTALSLFDFSNKSLNLRYQFRYSKRFRNHLIHTRLNRA